MDKQKNTAALRMAAFDLDGTVLNDGIMSLPVREALFSLRKSGITAAAASGRDSAQISPETAACFSYIVAANGAYIIDNSSGSLFQTHAMNKEFALKAVRVILRHNGGPFLFQCGTMTGAVRSPLYMPGARLSSYLKTKAKYCPHAHVTPFLSRHIAYGSRPIYKIQGFFPSLSACSVAADELREYSELEVLDMGDKTLELTTRGVTKAAALKSLCEGLGFSLTQLAAFGDSRNDLDMLLAAGFSVAMSNGADCVKEIADYIAGDVKSDGAAEAIYDIFGLDDREYL